MTAIRILFLMAGALALEASTIKFTTLPTVYQNGGYNGFAGATIDGVPGQSLMCDDEPATTYVPSSDLPFTEEFLYGPNPLQGARFAAATPTQADLDRYREAAVLVNGLVMATQAGNADAISDYQYAIWHLFRPNVALYRTSQQTLLDDAAALVAGGTTSELSIIYSNLRIYTPTAADASNQEFLGAVPEPEQMMLVMLALGAGALVRRMRRG